MQSHSLTHHDTICQVIDYLADKAIETYPSSADTSRIERGADIAKDGKVELLPDGTAKVQNSAGAGHYRVNGSCGCADSQYGALGGRCKHKYAKTLARRAHAVIAMARYAVTTEGNLHGVAFPSDDFASIVFLEDGLAVPQHMQPSQLVLLGRVSDHV